MPLQLVVDSKGDEHVAFAGKMYYLPAETWGNAHQVRLVWLVKALVDVCEEYEDGRCTKYEEMNRVQVIHTCGDDWTLTGLDVREDHGADYDVIYKDPAQDDDLDDDSTLLYLTYGLEKTFLAGSDCEDIDDKGTPDDGECISSDGERDITTDEIYRRWNYATSTVSETKRWSLDNHLTVITYTYATLDEALHTLATTETKKILDEHFGDHTSAVPTLLFAREERYRAANLDQKVSDDPDDTTWDTDGDRLSDAWELERSSISADEGGQFFDPRDPDTDDDGLDDYEQARLGNRFGGNNSCGSHENCELICSSASTSSGINYGDGHWHQVAHTFGGAVGGQRLYVDGELVASGEQDFSDYKKQNRLRIGYGEYQYGKYFDGLIDAVTVYPRALSDGEIRDAYRAALVVYPFDEPDGATNFENLVHNGYAGLCNGSACPTAGVEFDGGNDVIAVGNQANTVAERFYNFNKYSTDDEWWLQWDNDKTRTTPKESRKFLGRYGNETATLNLSSLPSHDRIEVEFDLFIIRTWDGNDTSNGPDYWELWADGQRQLRTTFSNNSGNSQSYPDEYKASHGRFTGAVERDTLGYDRDSVYHIETSFDHIADTLKLDFKALGLENLDNESWGLDNVHVYVINSNVPLANVSFTAAFWARRGPSTGSGQGAGYVISQGETSANQGLHISFRDNDHFTCAFYDDDLSTSAAYTDDDWHHWACTYDAQTGTRTIYHDGAQVAQDTASGHYRGYGSLEIGRGLGENGQAFGGAAGRTRDLARRPQRRRNRDLVRQGQGPGRFCNRMRPAPRDPGRREPVRQPPGRARDHHFSGQGRATNQRHHHHRQKPPQLDHHLAG